MENSNQTNRSRKKSISVSNDFRETSSIRITAEEWRSHCMAYENAAMSKVAYCKTHGLSVANFYYWHGKSRKKVKEGSCNGFLEVVQRKVGGMEQQLLSVEICLPNQTRLRVEMAECRLLMFIKELSHATAIIR